MNLVYNIFNGVFLIPMFSMNSLMRIIGKNKIQMWINTLLYPSLVIILNIIIGFKLDYRVNGFLISLGVAKLVP